MGEFAERPTQHHLFRLTKRRIDSKQAEQSAYGKRQ
jgi:hypothetical protein